MGSQTTYVAIVLALFHGVKITTEKCFKKMIVEIDALNVINILNQKDDLEWNDRDVINKTMRLLDTIKCLNQLC